LQRRFPAPALSVSATAVNICVLATFVPIATAAAATMAASTSSKKTATAAAVTSLVSFYSIGSDNNFDFEKSAYAATGCDIHTFDCIAVNATNKPSFVQFHPWCLGRGFMSLMDVMVALGHDNREISVLKMDCEGCEWSVLSHYRAFVSSGSMRRIRQLSLELHVSSFAAGVLHQFLDTFQWFYSSGLQGH